MKKWNVRKSSISGLGAFTVRPIQAEEAIDVGIDYYSSGNIRYPFVTEFGSWLNHSRTPNAEVVFDLDDDVYYIRASGYIPPNTEITVDYRKTPSFIEGPEKWFI